MNIRLPVIIINYKNYAQSYGESGLFLTKAVESVAEETGASIAIAPPGTDIYRLSQASRLTIYSQHIDPVGFGSHTGKVLPEAAREAGAVGTLINHSECRLTLAAIEKCIGRARGLDMGTVVCSNNIPTSAGAALLGPDFVAVEPPELIGGDISVSRAQPEIVEGSVAAVRNANSKVRVLCGAGVKNGEDVRKSLELGAEGVLLASGVVKAADPGKVLRDLVAGLG
jgi:triosephosphate isomerase